MLQIGILTMQRIINNGSLLQAYGLKKSIEILGHEVQFADYRVADATTEYFTWKERLQKFNSSIFLLLSLVKM